MEASPSTRGKRKTVAAAGGTRVPLYAVESVDNALKTLRMLCDSKRLTVSAVADMLGVAPSTAHRLLSMLVHHGFARQDERRGEYRTGRTIFEMGFAAIRDMELRNHSRPVLEELRDRVNETVHLGIRYGAEVLYVEGIESRRPLRIASRVGEFLPAHCVAVGKVLLAALSIEDLKKIYPSGHLPALTLRTTPTLVELERQLTRIRSLGFARSRGESDDGVGSIAVGVFDSRGLARAAISIAAPTMRITPEREANWIEEAKAAAVKLQNLLWSAPELDQRTPKVA